MDALALHRDGESWRLELRGDWSLQAMERINRDLEALASPISGRVVCDWARVEHPGLGPIWALLTRLADLGAGRLEVRHEGNPPPTVELLRKLQLELCTSHGKRAVALPMHEGAIARLGRWTVLQGTEAQRLLAFFGRIAAVLGEGLRHLRMLRLRSIVRHVQETGVSAIPIVSLIAFLISVVVAYLGAQQLARFGATIFVVDLVTIAVLREMGVLLTAIIVAGRSGSAFAAEIGVMQLNEETDALRAMGLNPIELLVVPRVLGLIIALPCLTIVADAMGLAGGGLLSLVQLHIPLTQFTIRLREALSPTTFWAGLVKAPVFALLIGMVGAYRGLQVRESARELGRLTTMAVVQSIFLVILADAFFAVLFEQINF
ncbi:MAG TPA: ABC transporter permease [Steroidobacteraceae bacterium]|nr:ABC transporter permease [Steroidobacteraceae bacterium]